MATPIALAFVLAALGPAQAAPATIGIAAARQSLVGRWDGKLEYRDYQADRWFGLPVKVQVRDGGDGVTLIRTADYDDGPTAGVVRITTVSMLSADGKEETSAILRKGRKVELDTAKLSLSATSALDRWTLVETVTGSDDDRPATLRYTTVRDGDQLVTTKEVDFSDDQATNWLVRNRTSLKRQPD